MDTNNQSSSGYFHDIVKKRRSLLTADVSGIKKPLETDGSRTASHGSFSDTFSPQEYNAERQLNNIQTRVEPDEDEFARMYSKGVPIYPQNTTGKYDVQKMHSDVPRNTTDSVTQRPQEEKKKGPWKWLWTFTGFSIVIGASIIAYMYAAEGNKHQSLSTGDDTDPQV